MEAWVTLVTNDSYSVGALTLAASLRRVNTTRQIVVMVATGVSAPIMEALKEVFDEIVAVEAMDSGDLANLTLLDRTDLGITFTKIRCWTLTQYSKAVFLDADTLVLQNCDELFERDEFSAAPDAGWPDCFNSGVFVFKPNLNTYNDLVNHAVTSGSFDGGDQGLLNTFFSSWAHKDISKHLAFTYNMVASATYSYLPAFKKFGQNVKIIHFIGASKPWLVRFDGQGEAILGSAEKCTSDFLRLWWQIFSSEVKPNVSKHTEVESSSSSSCGVGPAWVQLSCMGTAPMAETYSAPPPPLPTNKRESWEEGQPDFMGSASFENIKAKLDETMSQPPKTE